MVNYTPTPWLTDPSYPTDVYDNNDLQICDCDFQQGRESNDECLANAEFIVRAVNNFDGLLAALQAVVSVADRKTDEFDLAHAAIAKATHGV